MSGYVSMSSVKPENTSQTNQANSGIPFEVDGETIYLSPNSAEGKAVQRMKDVDDPSKWVTHGEIGEEIDVDAINQSLKEHGFTVQVSFPNSP